MFEVLTNDDALFGIVSMSYIYMDISQKMRLIIRLHAAKIMLFSRKVTKFI